MPLLPSLLSSPLSNSHHLLCWGSGGQGPPRPGRAPQQPVHRGDQPSGQVPYRGDVADDRVGTT